MDIILVYTRHSNLQQSRCLQCILSTIWPISHSLSIFHLYMSIDVYSNTHTLYHSNM